MSIDGVYDRAYRDEMNRLIERKARADAQRDFENQKRERILMGD